MTSVSAVAAAAVIDSDGGTEGVFTLGNSSTRFSPAVGQVGQVGRLLSLTCGLVLPSRSAADCIDAGVQQDLSPEAARRLLLVSEGVFLDEIASQSISHKSLAISRGAFMRYLGLLLCCAVTLMGCSQPEVIVNVHVAGLTSELNALQVHALLDDESAEGEPLLIKSRLDNFFLRLPTSASGLLSVKVGGRDMQGCVISQAEGSLSVLGPQRYDLSLELVPLMAKGCRLDLFKAGTGHGTILTSPGDSCGLDCRQHQIVAPPGTQIDLHVIAEKYSTLSGWGGACAGRGQCTVTIGSEPISATAYLVPELSCSSDRWCWETPRPPGVHLQRVWGIDASHVWAVGRAGGILYWNGSFWSGMVSGTDNDLYDIHGTSAADIWAAGLNGTLIHWNGSAWSTEFLGSTAQGSHILGVWPTGSTVWAVGTGGLILRKQGSASWQKMQSPIPNDLWSLWGASASDIWAVGKGGAIVHWNGTAWSTATSPTTELLHQVWGTSSNSVWAVGDNKTLLMWNGSAWLPEPVDTFGIRVSYYGLFGSSASDVWAVGSNGYMARRRNGVWQHSYYGATGSLYGVWMNGADQAWTVGLAPDNILQWDGTRWQSLHQGASEALQSLFGSGPNDVWAVGDRGRIIHWDGGLWSTIGAPTAVNLRSVWSGSPNNAWAVGLQGTILRWRNTAEGWQAVPSPTTRDLYSVFGFSSKDVWAAGQNGTLIHWDGTMWSSAASGTTLDLNALWGATGNSVWVIGNQGTVLHFDGAGWQPQSLPSKMDLSAIWGRNDQNLWVVGLKQGLAESFALWNGKSWALTSIPGVFVPWATWGTGPDEIWVASDVNHLVRLGGGSWNPVHLPANADGFFHAMWGSSPTDIWLAGALGGILRYRP